MRLIHIVESLDKGAVENWLVNIYLESRKTRPGWEWTFYCILGQKGRLDEKVREAGGNIIYSPVTISHKISFLKYLRKTLISGNYDIIHSHHDYLSGFYLISTIALSFRLRVLHIHNNDKGIPVGSRLLHKLLLPVFRWIGLKLSDTVLGISRYTLEEFKGNYKRNKPAFEVMYYGINMEPFGKQENHKSLKSKLNIPDNGKILLFVGRVIKEKNPEYVIEILERILQCRENVFALFVGTGDLENSVVSLSEKLKVKDNIRFIGWSDNVASIMLSSDVFVFPRLEAPKEGLGLVVVEAQSAGLPVFITEGIVRDAVIIPEMAYYNKLNDLDKWVKEIEVILEKGSVLSREEALVIMKKSSFELGNATGNLISFYKRRTGISN